MPPEDDLTRQELEDLVGFDPFKPEPSPAEPPVEDLAAPAPAVAPAPEVPVVADAGPTADAAGSAVPAASAPTSAVPPPSAGVGGGANVEVGILQKLVQDQTAQLSALREELKTFKGAVPTAPPASSDKPSQGPPDPTMPTYEYDVPDELVDALSSEDARIRKLAVKALVKGTAMSVHQELMKVLEPKFQDLPKSIENQMSARQSEAARREAVQKDFYGAYPELQHETLAPFVANVSNIVMKETGLMEWSPVLRDAIGNRARQILGMTAQAASPAPVAAMRPAVPAPPPAMQSSGTRPPTPASGRPVDEVWELVMGR